MRLWSIHPKYLDQKGLLAVWREALLAQKVLKGETKGYKKHPQLIRFKNTENPLAAVGYYLNIISTEAKNRNYNFDKTKILKFNFKKRIYVTDGQLTYEFKHLLKKLQKRDISRYNLFKEIPVIETNPLFKVIPGNIESWEKKLPS